MKGSEKNGSELKKITVKSKKYPGKLEFNQLYAVINEDNDIRINGSVDVTSGISSNIRTVSVYANLCNKENEILYVLNSYFTTNVKDNNYFSFSISCLDVSRFIDLTEFSYAELYVLINKDDDGGSTHE